MASKCGKEMLKQDNATQSSRGRGHGANRGLSGAYPAAPPPPVPPVAIVAMPVPPVATVALPVPPASAPLIAPTDAPPIPPKAPAIPYKWLKRVVKVFDLMKLTNADRVDNIHRLLQESYRKRKQDAFFRLFQGSLSTREYVDWFEDLYGFVSDILPSEEAKCDRFRQGLHIGIRSSMTWFRGSNFCELVEAALNVEKDSSLLNFKLVKVQWYSQWVVPLGHRDRDRDKETILGLNKRRELFLSVPPVVSTMMGSVGGLIEVSLSVVLQDTLRGLPFTCD
ncbi:hypothetical protein GH714_007890 [Hevea brasiliensis]|uniref:Retrotransposon gag domain-containing protein n=1 Tax=Hevea brasiliensis TaxID=3981 RepID=A0A6A6KAD6_HEVBR|nr:hypothetical protein GH714_007890 [Hevea brasiliensis]